MASEPNCVENNPLTSISSFHPCLQSSTKISSDAKSVKIKRAAGVTKFKIRMPRYLYTLRVTEAEKAEKLTQVLPQKLEKTDL